ncbi:MAG TPA: ATP-binding protein [Methanosphaera sp.]|nr:ATP-binding protein [Methanosphaera sp.]
MSIIYLKRYLDKIIQERLDMIGAIVIVGPKWCGKTTTAKQHANSILDLQNPDTFDSYKELSSFKPSLLLEGEKPRLIDEWQDIPVIWDAVRTSVDNSDGDGLYILTGSTVIDESRILHSGTGRFNRLLMKPMSLYESKESNGKIKLIDLFSNPDMNIDGIESNLSLNDLIFAACRGGWPESLNKKTTKAQLFIVENYLENICEVDVSALDGVQRDSRKIKQFLKSYARNISTLASNKTIIKDIKENFPEFTSNTFNVYLNILTRLFVIEEVNAWNPNIRSASAMRSSSKREFIDPSIAVAALNLEPEGLLYDLNTFGFIFETLCIRDLSIYTYEAGGTVSYYHDKYGLEADCVIHLKNGDYALIEFKLGRDKIDYGAENLLKLDKLIKKNIKEKNLRMKEPKFLAVITGTKYAYTRDDGVKVLPIGCLK